MTFDEYWNSLVKKTPQLKKGDTKMSLTVSEFRYMLLLTYRKGASSNTDEVKKAAEDFGKVKRKEKLPLGFDGLFDSLFGR